MQRYDDYRNVPSGKGERASENGTMEKRTPIRPRETMKDILYNGVGVGEEVYQKAGSRVGFVVCSSKGPTPTMATTITEDHDINDE